MPGGSPYSIAIDPDRGYLWVTLTAENRLVQYDMTQNPPHKVESYPTVRQPNSVAVNPDTGFVCVAGAADNELQIIDSERGRIGGGTSQETTGG